MDTNDDDVELAEQQRHREQQQRQRRRIRDNDDDSTAMVIDDEERVNQDDDTRNIKIQTPNNHHNIPYDTNRFKTVGDIRRYIQHTNPKENLDYTEFAYHDEEQGTTFTYTSDSDRIAYSDHPLLTFSFRLPAYDLWLIDAGVKALIHCTPQQKIKDVRDEYGTPLPSGTSVTGVTHDITQYVGKDRYSYKGESLNEITRIGELPDIESSPSLLIEGSYEDGTGEFSYNNIQWNSVIAGRIRLTIVSAAAAGGSSAETTSIVIYAYPDERLSDLIERYERASNRQLIALQYTLTPDGETEPLNMTETLYQQHVVDDNTLDLSTEKYKVTIKEYVTKQQADGTADNTMIDQNPTECTNKVTETIDELFSHLDVEEHEILHMSSDKLTTQERQWAVTLAGTPTRPHPIGDLHMALYVYTLFDPYTAGKGEGITQQAAGLVAKPMGLASDVVRHGTKRITEEASKAAESIKKAVP